MKYVKPASEELYDMTVKLLNKMTEYRRSMSDDDYDAGYKDGARKALDDAVVMIIDRQKELREEGESDG